MNTMKKEDMQIEQSQLVTQIGRLTLHILQPFAQLVGACQRIAYLENQIQLVTPKPTIVPDQEKKDDKVDSQKATS